jgi:hypothetical protein
VQRSPLDHITGTQNGNPSQPRTLPEFAPQPKAVPSIFHILLQSLFVQTPQPKGAPRIVSGFFENHRIAAIMPLGFPPPARISSTNCFSVRRWLWHGLKRRRPAVNSAPPCIVADPTDWSRLETPGRLVPKNINGAQVASKRLFAEVRGDLGRIVGHMDRAYCVGAAG